MKPVVSAVVEAGLVDESILNEMARWGIHVTAKPDEEILLDKAAVVERIREAIESSDQVRIDETELDLLSRYLDKAHQKSGRLIIKEGKRHQTMKVTFCLTHLGEYAVPWTEEDTPDILMNGESHLKWVEGEKQHDIYFTDVREVFFGTRKAFVVCTPSKEQTND